MAETIKCLICDNAVNSIGNAVIMPFITYRMLGIKSKKLRYTELLKCNYCGFLFYKQRFTDFEVNKYYDGYFNKDYFKQRHEYEWWFTYKYVTNNKEANRINEIQKRKIELDILLQQYKNKIKTILDYGGNVGGLVSDNFEYSVYDINKSKIDINKKFDLVMLNCVLEHVSYPKKLLENLKFEYIYIEVPIIKPLVLSLKIKRKFKQYVIDIWKILRYRSLYQMHEHINYFDERSLLRLSEILNCEVLFFDKANFVYRMLIRKNKQRMGNK